MPSLEDWSKAYEKAGIDWEKLGFFQDGWRLSRENLLESFSEAELESALESRKENS